jgi:hypothetical protein
MNTVHKTIKGLSIAPTPSKLDEVSHIREPAELIDEELYYTYTPAPCLNALREAVLDVEAEGKVEIY